MEKSRSYNRRKLHNRLLICAIFSLFLSAISAQDSGELQFTQIGDFTVSVDSEFSLDLVGVSPSDIEIITRSFPSGVRFISSSKKDGFIRTENNTTQKGTSISYALRFSVAGTYDLGALPVMINNTLRSIDFPVITVLPNPDVLIPEFFIEQEGPLFQLKESSFTLSARYFKRIEYIHVSLSEYALIEQHPIMELPSVDRSFSGETIPIARFSCTPFSQGRFSFPDITVTCIAYNGSRHEIAIENSEVNVIGMDNYTPSTYGEERYALNVTQDQSSMREIEQNEDLVQSLASLRIEEKYAFFPFDAKNKRRQLESTENLENADEVSSFWIQSILAVGLLCVLCGFLRYVLFEKKSEEEYSSFSPLFFVLGIIFLGFSFFYGWPLLQKHAVVYGTTLYTIPEHESKVVSTLNAGTRVEIEHTVSDWYLVLLPDGREGWLLQSECILIEKGREE